MTSYSSAQSRFGPPACCGAPMCIDPDRDEATCARCGSKLSGQTGERTSVLRGWRLTIRTAPGAPIAAEYECPVHGRFAVDVPREANGDPPAEVRCTHARDPRMFELFGLAEEERAARKRCYERAPFVISAPGIARVRKVEAIRGGYQKAERPTWTDTTNLGEGQDLDDWKADRAKVWERENERQAMELAREL